MNPVPELDNGRQWALIVISRKSHTLRYYSQADTRVEAREKRKKWLEDNDTTRREFFVYIGRTRGLE